MLSQEGKLLAFLPVPTDEVTNCAFGGPGHDELYLAHLHADYVGKIALGRRGHLLSNQR